MRKRSYPAALALACALFAPMAAGEAAEAAQPPVLEVEGRGQVQSAPDEASITLGVVTRAETAQAAQAENAEKANAIREAVRALGVADADIQTEDYSFRPDYQRESNERMTIAGYTASNTLRVRVRDLSLTGEVMDAALQSGANTIHSLDFSIRNTDALRKKALESAVKDAREKAETLARALGMRVAGVRRVSENTGAFQPRMNRVMTLAKQAAEDAAGVGPIEAGTLSLTADVHIEFALAE